MFTSDKAVNCKSGLSDLWVLLYAIGHLSCPHQQIFLNPCFFKRQHNYLWAEKIIKTVGCRKYNVTKPEKLRYLLEQFIKSVPKLWNSTIFIPLVLQKAALLWYPCTTSVAHANFAVYLPTLLCLLPIHDNFFQNFLYSSSAFTPPNQNSSLSEAIFFSKKQPSLTQALSSLAAFPLLQCKYPG